MNKTTEIAPLVLPSGIELTRTVSETGLVTTNIPREHFKEYEQDVFAKCREAVKVIAR